MGDYPPFQNVLPSRRPYFIILGHILLTRVTLIPNGKLNTTGESRLVAIAMFLLLSDAFVSLSDNTFSTRLPLWLHPGYFLN